MTRQTRPQMSSSWASNMDGRAESSMSSIDSRDIAPAPEPPLTRSQVRQLHDQRQDSRNIYEPSPRAIRQSSSGFIKPLSTSASAFLSQPTDRQRVASANMTASPSLSAGRRHSANDWNATFSAQPQLNQPTRRQPPSKSRPQPRVDSDSEPDSHSDSHSGSESPPAPPPSRRLRKPRSSRNPQKLRSSPQTYTDAAGHYFLDTVLSAFRVAANILKPLISYLLAAWIIIGSLIFLRNLMYERLNTALTPLCHIPGATLLNLSFCEPPRTQIPKGAAEFDKLLTVQAAFDDVFTQSAGDKNLPMAMKRCEISIGDLRSVVRYSNLPSREELVFEFDSFITAARDAGRNLQNFNTHISGSLDRILSVNKWTLRELAAISDSEAHRGSLMRLISSINIFSPFLPATTSLEDQIMERYLEHTASVQEKIAISILKAEALHRDLTNLDERLDTMAGISARDGLKVENARDELLAHLWTKLGGNKHDVAKSEANLELLREVTTYRKIATSHVAATILKLQAIESNLDDLMHRVSTPEVVGVVGHGVPFSIYIEQISMSIERFTYLRDNNLENEKRQMKAIHAALDEWGEPKKLVDIDRV